MPNPVLERNRAFGLNLRRYRKQRGLRQADLAREAALSQTQVSRMERGYEPGLFAVIKLVEALEIPLSDLLHGVYEYEAEENTEPRSQRGSVEVQA